MAHKTLRLAYLMARTSESPASHVFPCATFRRSLAVALALAVFLVARPSARAVEPDPWFGRDKLMHLSVSFALAGTSYATAAGITKRTSVRVLSGAGIALSAGIAKELYDRSSGGDASWRDLSWDAIGTATGTLVAWLVDRYLF
jgi:putative lipoprotein